MNFVLDNKAMNYNKVMCLYDYEIEPDPKAICDDLDNATELVKYRHVRKGFMITVAELNNYYYLIQCVKHDESGSYINNIYVSENKNDMLAIAKFLNKNLMELAHSYKEQIENVGVEYQKWVG